MNRTNAGTNKMSGSLMHRLSVATLVAAAMVYGSSGSAAAEKRALLVGIGAYQNISPLKGPPSDVGRMERFLRDHWGYAAEEIAVLLDDRATYRNMISTIEHWLINSTQAGDEVVFYYSGHGAQVDDLNGDEDDGLDETLVAYDATNDGTNQLTDDEFGALLDRLQGRRVTVIVDACFSGTITRSLEPRVTGDMAVRTIFAGPRTRGSPAAVKAHRGEEAFIRTAPRRIVWTAASSYQLSWESNGEGVFTSFFIEGAADRLADSNGNGIVTNAELLDYTRSRTKAWCDAVAACTLGFTPTLEADASAMAEAVVPIGAVAPPGGDQVTDLINQENEAGVTVEILPSNTIALGQSVRFRIASGRPGRLFVLDVDAAGAVTQIYPNDFSRKHGKDGRIAGGRSITIPDKYYGFEFTASEPKGDGTVIAVVIEDDTPLEDLFDRQGDLSPIADPAAYLAALAERLRQVWTKDETNRELRWSLAEASYRIVDWRR